MRPRQTSHTPKKRHKNRIFWLSTTMLVLFVVSIIGLRVSMCSALAIEQEARCGLQEHVHTDDCYLDNLIICPEKAHAHSNNCYLLLLEDNDINMLLTEVSKTEDKSLEALIAGVLGEAVRLNDMKEEPLEIVDVAQGGIVPLAAELPDGANTMRASYNGNSYGGTEVSQLNNIIDTFALEPAMVLNEGLAVPMAAEEEIPEMSGSGNDGIMTAAVTPSTDTYKANIYIYLDGEWQCIENTKEFSTTESWGTYTRYILAENLTGYVNAKIDSDFTTNLNASNWKYNVESKSTTPNASTDNNDNNKIVFGTYWIFGDTKGPIHLYLYDNNAAGTIMNFYTVTVIDINGNSSSYIYKSGTNFNLDSNYNWEKTVNGVTTDASATESIGNTTTFRARPKQFDVNIYVNDVKDEAKSLTDQNKAVNINLGILYPGSNYIWFDGDDNRITNLNQTVNKDTTFKAYTAHTVTYYIDGVENRTELVRDNSTITLDSAYIWRQDSPNGTKVSGDRTITEDVAFYGILKEDISVSYDVSFVKADGANEPTQKPTLYGTGNSTATDEYDNEDTDITIRNVSSREVQCFVNQSANFYRVSYFAGWQVEGTETIISPDTVVTFNELKAYDSNGDGVVTLTGKWETAVMNSASFYIRVDSAAVDTNGNITGQEVTKYTNCVFATHVGGKFKPTDSNLSQYHIADTSSDNSYGADQAIRALYGNTGGNVWLYDFPDDEDMFRNMAASLKEGQTLTATNSDKQAEAVDMTKLDTDHYAIRWYVFKTEGDSWHIDGKLVKKEGSFEVIKTFAGNTSLLEAAKNGYSITATNGTTTRQLRLADAEQAGAHTYKWVIDKLSYGEAWNIIENMPTLDSVITYPEWTIIDTTNVQSAAGKGTATSINAVTYPIDTENTEKLQVAFNNIYYPTDSLMLKKEDKMTGQALPGAEFKLYQVDKETGKEKLMYFYLEDGLYKYLEDPTTRTDEVSTLTFDGYLNLNISIANFSYTSGNIIVRETKAPAGYNLVGDVLLGQLTDEFGTPVTDINGNPVIGMLNDADEFADFDDNMLTVLNSSHSIDVTAEKEWYCPAAYQAPVVIELLANGSLALASQLTDHATVTLNSSNGYQYFWNDLPTVANNIPITWTIREIKIGDESCKSDYTFAHWANAYTTTTEKDANGNVISAKLTVSNTMKRPMLYLTKMNWEGVLFLPGATFRIVEVDSSGNEIAGTEKILTTGSDGKLIFDNLKYDTRYKLTETAAPEGYWVYSEENPAYLMLAEGGTVTIGSRLASDGSIQGSHDYVSAGSNAYNIQVKNRSAMPMPETGGDGTLFFTIGGMMLMAGVFTYYKMSNKKTRRRGVRRRPR